MSERDAIELATNPERVSRHSFLPFIQYEMEEPRYRANENAVQIKRRPIAFASHADSHIYSYFSHQLRLLHEEALSETLATECVLAYRAFPGGKCNIHFANEAFQEVGRRGDCVAIAMDVEDFFGSLQHELLKSAWMRLLNRNSLPPDHYAVWKNLCKYSWILRDELFEEFGIGRRKQEVLRRPFSTPKEFRDRVRGNGLIHRNLELHGIPQGSPISAIASNVYMLEIDKTLSAFAAQIDCSYRRYSDDILLIGSQSQVRQLESQSISELLQVGLRVNPAKTLTTRFARNLDNTISCDVPMQYLGLCFDGQRKTVRPKTLARYSQRARRAITSAARATRKVVRNGRCSRIRKRKLFDRYSHLGNRNFISYVYRLSRIVDDRAPRRQVRRHWSKLNQLIDETNVEFGA
jgi:RNA-directed DNA polymerase